MDFYRAGRPRQGEKRGGARRSYRNAGEQGDSTSVDCSGCGERCTVPFVPSDGRPVYCRECFAKNRPGSGGDRAGRGDQRRPQRRDARPGHADRRSDRPPAGRGYGQPGGSPARGRPGDRHGDARGERRGGRPQRYDRQAERYDRHPERHDRQPERRERSGSSRPPKGRQGDSRFSGGSEKFYRRVREKLFEILGGTACSGCGFRDERALGFARKSDASSFDDVRRGGAASSWEKYISRPDLARSELVVLCLNCSRIRSQTPPTDSE